MFNLICSITGAISVLILIIVMIISDIKDIKAKAANDKEWNDFVIKERKVNEDFKLQQEESQLRHKEFMEKFNAQTPIIFAEAQKEWERQQAEDAIKPLSNEDAEQALREFEDLCKRIEASCNSILATCDDINKQNNK